MFDSIRNEHVFLFFFPSIYLSALDKSDNRVQVVDIHPGPQLFWFPCLFTSHEVCKSSALFLCALRSFRCVRERFGGATMCSVGFRVSFYYMSDAARHRRCRKATKTEDYATPGERLGGSWARGRGGRETKLDYTTSHCRGPCVQYNDSTTIRHRGAGIRRIAGHWADNSVPSDRFTISHSISMYESHTPFVHTTKRPRVCV